MFTDPDISVNPKTNKMLLGECDFRQVRLAGSRQGKGVEVQGFRGFKSTGCINNFHENNQEIRQD